jgi:putative oxidoreductase
MLLTLTTPELTQIGLTIIRIGVGILFIGHGYLKLSRGISELTWTGQQMANLGITFAPLFWGICAMLSELLGGISLTLGLGVRLATPFMIFTMFVAIVYHLRKGDSYGYYSFPMSQLVVFLGLLIAGSGIYSLDHYFFS